MKRRSNREDVQRMNRNFWIAVALTVILGIIIVLVDNRLSPN